MILGENNEKMSKSKGNVVNPDEIVESHGADTLRLYEMFMGPLEASIAWSTNGLDGARRFLDRVWRLLVEEDGTAFLERSQDVRIVTSIKRITKPLRKVTEDYEGLRFNTGISQLMVFINDAYKADELPKEYVEGFIKLLSPIAPHMTEELWSKLGHEGTISYEAWPTFDESKLVDNEVEIVLQVNGKVKAKVMIPTDMNKRRPRKTCDGT